MKPIVIIFLLVLNIACVSLKEKQVNTANKVGEFLFKGNSKELLNLIVSNPDENGNDINSIMRDSKLYKYIINKYGYPDTSKINYEFNKNDFIIPYKVVYTIFEGKDTLLNWEVSKIYLQVDFGPRRFNPPSKIAGYKLEIEINKLLKVDPLVPWSPTR